MEWREYRTRHVDSMRLRTIYSPLILAVSIPANMHSCCVGSARLHSNGHWMGDAWNRSSRVSHVSLYSHSSHRGQKTSVSRRPDEPSNLKQLFSELRSVFTFDSTKPHDTVFACFPTEALIIHCSPLSEDFVFTNSDR